MPDASEELAALVALLHVVGPTQAHRAVEAEARSPTALLAEELGASTRLLPDDPAPHVARARRDIDAWRRSGIAALGIRDAAYPDALRAVHDRPPLLFAAGDVSLLSTPPAIAVVGSRRASSEGLARVAAFARELAGAGFTIASGLATGVDAIAHRTAIGVGGRTIAVVGTGLAVAYPPENAGLQAEIAADHVVVSALWPDSPPTAEHFRERNALMSALSRGTVIVEASSRSGTRVQARRALAHGRPVFLSRALLAQSWARDLAARPAVHVVDSAADVLAVIARVDGPPTDGER